MSFQRVHRSKSQSPQFSSSTSQFAPRPFSVQEPKRLPTQEHIENEAFQQNKFEAFGLQLKEKHSTITPVEKERLGVLQAKMDSFWAQRMERAKAQPNLLEILIRNSQATQTTESQAPVQTNTIQAKSDTTGDRPGSFVEQHSNKTGMPDTLKAGVENLSGYSLDDVRVHYNSPKPTQLQALAYTQGTDIHVAPGQEKHLPHEAWHVVQQMRGRVKPTMQLEDGVPVNNDETLEREADLMGTRAASALPNIYQEDTLGVQSLKDVTHRIPYPKTENTPSGNTESIVVQRVKFTKEKKEKLLTRLRTSFKRNKIRKAKPRLPRHIFTQQRTRNYGYPDAEIAKYIKDKGISNALTLFDPKLSQTVNPSYSQIGIGDASGYFRKGFGGQPFLYLNSEAYDDKMIGSNYDEIINYFKGNDAQIAVELLEMIQLGEGVGKDKSGQAKSLFVLLTQFIEAHSSRIPGVDKLARALLRRIALGQLTFKEAFNRKNGLFVSAWATKAGAPKGGQVAGRALFGFSKDTDKYNLDKLEEYLGNNAMDELLETVDGYYSDDSDSEDGDVESEASKAPEFHKGLVKEINAALTTLGFSEQLKDAGQIALLPVLAEQLNKQYMKLVLKHHPDKGGNQEAFQAILGARELLQNLISQVVKSGFVDLSKRNLDALLQHHGFRPEPVRGDGNCFYSAVLDQISYLDGVAADSSTLRGRVAQLILDNAATLQVFVTGAQLNRIVNDILTSHSWSNMGGDFAPQLIATVLQRPVQIIQPTGLISIAPRGDLMINASNTFITGSSTLTIIYDGSTHYDSTRSTRGAIMER